MQQSCPEVVLVAANCLEARRIHRLMKDYSETLDKSRRPVVVFGDPTVAQLFVKTSQAEQEFKALPNIIKEGISLARYMQNPMAEILGLWSDRNQDNAVFYIPFHPLQNQLTLNRLKKEYEKVAMEVSNSIGISVNELNYRHLSTGLQFLCGMGPRKASQLLEDLKNPSIEKIRNRADLFNLKLMGKKVYTNIAGFIRIKAERDFDALDFEETSGKVEPLDGTRIHPETYLLAKKIAKDAVDEDCPINEWIPRVIKAPYKLRDLDLEDYAQHLAAYKNKPNMLHILSFIVEELTFPFRDPRNRSWELNEKEVFFKLTKENPESFKPKGFTNVKIQKVFFK